MKNKLRIPENMIQMFQFELKFEFEVKRGSNI